LAKKRSVLYRPVLYRPVLHMPVVQVKFLKDMDGEDEIGVRLADGAESFQVKNKKLELPKGSRAT
jgi:hypothetical protein